MPASIVTAKDSVAERYQPDERGVFDDGLSELRHQI